MLLLSPWTYKVEPRPNISGMNCPPPSDIYPQMIIVDMTADKWDLENLDPPMHWKPMSELFMSQLSVWK